MDRMKEYIGVIVALVTVMAAVAALGLWAIQVQIDPEIRRVDGRIDSLRTEVTERLDRMDNRFEARFVSIENEVKLVRKDVGSLRGDVSGLRGDVSGLRGEVKDLRGDVNVVREDVGTIRDDIKTILLRLPKPNETSMTVRGNP